MSQHEQGVPQAVQQFLSNHPAIDYIHYHVVDLAAILRARVLPRDRCLKLAQRNEPKRVGIGSIVGHANFELMPDEYRQGSDAWYPDWSSLRLLDSHNASVICRVSEEKVNHKDKSIDDLFRRCPRTVLHRVVELGVQEADLNFLIGFELEFYLVSVEGDRLPAAHTSLPACNYWSTANSLRGQPAECLKACVRALELADVEIDQFHAEMSPGQFEISLCPLSPLSAVDTAVQSMEIVRQVASEHKMRAVFHPSPFPDFDFSGFHLHVSIANEMEAQSRASAPAFLAGVLRRLLQLCALGMPHGELWQARSGRYGVGEWVAWGTENRHVPVRAIDFNHWEFRAIDATANPYVVTAAYLAAGILGIREKELLRLSDCLDMPHRLTPDERQALGITCPLPSTGDTSYATLESDPQGLDDILGQDFLSYYHSVRKSWQPMEADKWRQYLLASY